MAVSATALSQSVSVGHSHPRFKAKVPYLLGTLHKYRRCPEVAAAVLPLTTCLATDSNNIPWAQCPTMDYNIDASTSSDNSPPRYSTKRRSLRTFLVGWRRAAAYLIALIFSLAALLLSGLLVSLYGLPNSPKSISNDEGNSTTTLIFRGSCDASTKYNFWGHLAINLIASGVLASSNFFMQVLVAPTRSDVDRAHAKGVALEIGVQSWRNLFHVPLRNTIFWVLLAVSTIPLHLVFNSTILESRASTDFLMLMASEEYVRGAPWDAAGASGLQKGNRGPPRMNDIQKSLAENPSRWEKMDVQSCYARYNDTSRALFERRDVVMVLGLDPNDANNNNTGSFGWTFNNTAENSLWYFAEYYRTDLWVGYLNAGRWFAKDLEQGFGQDMKGNIKFDLSTSTVHNNASIYPPGLRTMKAEYCLSESWTAPCRVEVDNTLLFVVVLICSIKLGLCVIILITARGPTPLITPGDAIESFITKPDATTAGMCAFRPRDLDNAKKGYQWIPSARQWTTEKKSRRSLFAVPRSIWIWSYMLIGGSLTVGLIFLVIATQEQWITDSEFGHDAKNRQMEMAKINPSKTNIIVLANTPQLILSMCYFAYNGLFTRILCAFEWDKFSVMYKSLRVTHRKGAEQRSTYRLQLPYRWSIPLLLVSAILHWLYSNSFYLTIFESKFESNP